MATKFLLRLPDDLRRRLEYAADAEAASLTWTIQNVLDKGLPHVNDTPPQQPR